MSALRSSAEQDRAIGAVIGLSGRWFALSALLALCLALLAQHSVLAYTHVAVVAAMAIVSVLASLRFYNRWVSWAAWLIPFVPLWFAIDRIRSGIISIASALFIYALAFAIMFGILHVARGRLRKWLSNGAF
jgi:hypothetical protein